ncbi:glycerol-3-phosphate dehydrogenase [Acidithiobacillus marinus]|uniref:Glycerol-3-phosphate dehydrogenase [NAD(P)+] n=1 Tax=Acidithiobacillus marinus TaxID=187490 RepID=A0A2I1DNW6_9PROT|nr:NAD(P)H-dependent glycerol-3-phosphate dehydrogenase [Acidithiobacillus marinus]PKY11568.1 glycerol-3-phosphate dehydrogenase [Acidithiobacillus marinus]
MSWAVLGAGHWGTALAVHLCRQGQVVRLWGRNPQRLPDGSNPSRLSPVFPDLPWPAGLGVEPDLATAVAGAEGIVLAVPSHALRSLLNSLSCLDLSSETVLVLAAKGLELPSALRLDQVVQAECRQLPLVVLSGPSFAHDLVLGKPLAMTAASHDMVRAQRVAGVFVSDQMRVYRSDDVAGVCLGGAIKNVLAIAAGISDGLDNGDSARAALITRGIAELHRLGTALGGRTETFMGLTGTGDLILTASSDLSRNRRVGIGLGRGETLEKVLADIGQEAEGVRSAQALFRLARRLGVEMPITEQVYRVLYTGADVRQASEQLMRRAARAEHPAALSPADSASREAGA